MVARNRKFLSHQNIGAEPSADSIRLPRDKMSLQVKLALFFLILLDVQQSACVNLT
jgi:hypothetical protein